MSYVAIPRRRRPPAGWTSETETGWQDRPTMIVHESTDGPVDTGLVDAQGSPIYRLRDTVPFGFQAPE